jgi:gliding motility-associated-like protein
LQHKPKNAIMLFKTKRFFLCWVLFVSANLYAQDIPPFTLNGTATQTSPACYTLTADLTGQAGSIWSQQQINLNESFEAEVLVYLGCSSPNPCFEDSDDGADGMVFAFQPISTNIGNVGGGMGILGIAPSLCIELDTYPNGAYNDPSYDHIHIFSNGDIDHLSATNSLSLTMPLINTTTNVEDCAEHTLNVRWNANTQTMTVYFDCVLKVTYVGDAVNDIFGGNPNVYWGFTAATGSCTSEQRVCVNVPPTFQVNDTTICLGQAVELAAPEGATTYAWTPVTGLSNPNIANPIASPFVSTIYNVATTNECGFVSNYAITVWVNEVYNLQIDTFMCAGTTLTIGGTVYSNGGTFNYTGTSVSGCDSTLTINITEIPNTTAEVFDTICIGNSYILPNFIEVNTSGNYTAVIPNTMGCDSTITVHLTVNNPNCDDNDCNTTDSLDTATCTCLHTPIAPPNCDDNNCNTTDAYDALTCTCTHTPIAPPNCDDNNCNTTDAFDSLTCQCTHTPITPPTCDDGNPATLDSYNATTCTCEHISNSVVIVPTAFSPNGDGVNDKLRVFGTNLTSSHFRVYNRWGQMVFESSDASESWNGLFRDTPQEMGIYVYVLDYTTADQPTVSKTLKGNITLLR